MGGDQHIKMFGEGAQHQHLAGADPPNPRQQLAARIAHHPGEASLQSGLPSAADREI